MIFVTDKPVSNERRAELWGERLKGHVESIPRFMADFDRVFARQYEAEAIADAAPSLEDRP